MFRHFYLVTVFIFFLCGCKNNSNTLKIKGKIDSDNTTKIYHIIADLNNQPKTLDTLDINQGIFELETELNEPSFHFLQISGQNGTFPFVAESGTVKIQLFKDSLGASKATGTISNDDFMRYKNETKAYVESLNGIGNDLQQAMILKDSLLAQDLQEQYQDVRDQIQDYELNFLRKSSNSLISILILERFVSNNTLSKEESKTLYDLLSDRIKNTKSGRAIEKILDQPEKAEVGNVAPPFEGPTPDGKKFALKNALGKITIIDFWASWCRPCRIENPNLVQLYKKNKDRGLNILGVSLDRDKEKWVKAIEEMKEFGEI